MTFDPPILPTARKGPRLQDGPPGPGAAARWMGVILAVVLFGVDAFHPVIGLVEVPQAADKEQAGDPVSGDSQSAQNESPTVVSIHSWQWNPSNAEFCPAFVLQPTISAGSGGAAGSAGSAFLSAAVLLPSPLAFMPSSPPALGPDPLPGQLQALQLVACREICPIGPPLV